MIRLIDGSELENMPFKASDPKKTLTENSRMFAHSLRQIMKGNYTKTGSALYNEIDDRNSAAKIAQLRAGHCALNRYLHRFGKMNTPYCQCGYGKEIMEYYLL